MNLDNCISGAASTKPCGRAAYGVRDDGIARAVHTIHRPCCGRQVRDDAAWGS